MSRYFLDIALFLLPFAAYAIYLFLRDINPFTGAAWTFRQVALLAVIGVVLSVFLLGFLSRHAGQQLVGRNEAGMTSGSK